MKPIVHHIAIQTGKFRESIIFYRNLGLIVLEEKRFKKRELSWIDAGTVLIELYSKKDDEELDAWSDRYSGPVHLAFSVQNFPETIRELREKKIPFHPSHPEPFLPPVANAKWVAYLLGPDGEEVEIREA